MTRGPFATLTRHFVGVLLAPPLLTDLGADYLRRTIASLVAMVLVAGIFLTRVFFQEVRRISADSRIPTRICGRCSQTRC